MRRFKAILTGFFALTLILSGFLWARSVDAQGKQLKVAGVYSTPIEEPWIQVIHRAFNKIKGEFNLHYEYTEKVSAADYERVVREYISRGFDVISGESFINEGASRRIAKEFPKTKFLMGSGLGPAEPNFAVFDNWLHEASYLAGLLAGKTTKTNVLGVVGGYAVGEVNRLVNAFKIGVKEANPKAKVKITFIGTWFNPPKAKEAAFAQIEAGADLLYAERHGVIEAAHERKKLAIGNLLDQNEEAPDTVITSVTWNMEPTLRAAFKAIRGGYFRGIDYAEYTMLRKGGAALAPWHGWEKKLSPEVLKMIDKRKKEILAGTFRVPVNEAVPQSD
jgi:basic membrane lipoprotein Med (substrate-binding protein (PBP1-ABC) superfamily)